MADPAPVRRPTLRYGPLSQSIGFLLRLSQLRNFAAFYKDLSPLGVRPGELTVLMMLRSNPGVRQGVLAEALMIKRAHMTKMIRAMEREGWVSRSKPEDDRRAVELRLTARGMERLEQLDPPFKAFEDIRQSPLTPQEEQELVRLLRRFLDLPDEPPDNPHSLGTIAPDPPQ